MEKAKLLFESLQTKFNNPQNDAPNPPIDGPTFDTLMGQINNTPDKTFDIDDLEKAIDEYHKLIKNIALCTQYLEGRKMDIIECD